jgi:predicted fused transcriptional regulator/phosphomethylpyrimidine kinase
MPLRRIRGMTMTTEERDDVVRTLRSAVEQLARTMHPTLIPEVGTNIVYAIRDARTSGDVAAVEGRIVRAAGQPTPVGQVAFGASDHVARIVLTVMKFDPDIRSAANIRYSPGIISVIEDLFLEICSFDRGQEPPGTKTMDWGVAFCCKNGVPDVIFDKGAVGKEPMVRILGEDPLQVAITIGTISSRIEQGSPA